MLQKSSLAAIASRSASEKSATPAFIVPRVIPCALQRVTPRLAQSRGCSLRVESLDSLVAWGLPLWWPSCLMEPPAQGNANASCSFLIPTYLDLNLLARTSDATLLTTSCQSAMIKFLVEPPPEFNAYPMSTPGSIFVPKLLKSTFAYRRHWIKINLSPKKMPEQWVKFQIFFHTVTYCLPVCLVCVVNNRAEVPSLTLRTEFSAFLWVYDRYGLYVLCFEYNSSQVRINSREFSVRVIHVFALVVWILCKHLIVSCVVLFFVA